MKVDMERVFFVIEQKLFELEDEKVRHGRFAQVLDAQIDTVHEIMRELEDTFKYKNGDATNNAPVKKISKRRGS